VAGPWVFNSKHKQQASAWTDINKATRLHARIRRRMPNDRQKGGCSCLTFKEVCELVLYGDVRKPSRRIIDVLAATTDANNGEEQAQGGNEGKSEAGDRFEGWGPLLDWRNTVVTAIRKSVDLMQVFTATELKSANTAETGAMETGSNADAGTGGRGGERSAKVARTFEGCDGRGTGRKRSKPVSRQFIATRIPVFDSLHSRM
jgi:hypothetical protein